MEAAWYRYCTTGDDKPSKVITKFHRNLSGDVVSCFRQITEFALEQPAEPLIYSELRKLHMIKLSYYFNAEDLW
jgi:hypothetical protein